MGLANWAGKISKTACSLQYPVGVPSQQKEVSRAKVNYVFENLEGEDEVSSEASAFQRDEVG